MGDLQFGHCLELVTSHRQLAALSISIPSEGSSSGFTSPILSCHCCHCSHPLGAWTSPRHSLIKGQKIWYTKKKISLPNKTRVICNYQQKKWPFPQSTAWDVGAAEGGGVCSVSGSRTACPQPGLGHHFMQRLLSTKAFIEK